MIVHVNGEPTELEEGATVAGLLSRLRVERQRRGIAVAVDAEVVPRGDWERRPLSDGAHVELLSAIQGG
jgi:sulfur carrier protein